MLAPSQRDFTWKISPWPHHCHSSKHHPGIYLESQINVEISSATPDAIIQYTTDNTDPETSVTSILHVQNGNDPLQVGLCSTMLFPFVLTTLWRAVIRLHRTFLANSWQWALRQVESLVHLPIPCVLSHIKRVCDLRWVRVCWHTTPDNRRINDRSFYTNTFYIISRTKKPPRTFFRHSSRSSTNLVSTPRRGLTTWKGWLQRKLKLRWNRYQYLR